MGPLLFIMYLHDVPKHISPKFADDLVAVAVSNDIDDVVDKLQSAADQLVNWAKDEDMILNAEKTKVMTLGTVVMR